MRHDKGAVITNGIEVREGEYFQYHSDEPQKHVYSYTELGSERFVMGETAFLTYEDAVIAARAMRDNKIESLEKQIDRISYLIFPTKESVI